MWLGLYLILLPLVFGFTLQGSLVDFQPFNADNTKIVVTCSDQEILEVLPDLEGKFSVELPATEKYFIRMESVSLYALRFYTLDLTAEPELQSINPGTLQPISGETSKLPLSIPTKQTVFSVPRPKFSLYKQLKSPTVYLSLLMLLASALLPKIVASIQSDLAEAAKQESEVKAGAVKSEIESNRSTTGNNFAAEPTQEKQTRAKRREALRKGKRT